MKFSGALLLAAAVSLAVADTAVSAATSCCSVLAAKVPGKVFYSTSTTYNVSMEGFWSLQATFDDPSCILRPTLNTDVAAAVKALAGASCQFSIKGGGHTPWKGAASIDKGVMIDMTTINATTVNAAGDVASIGAGARWGNIYTALSSLGKMVAGGRDSDVGIGGLVLGGGYSWFTSKMGFVADGVVNFEMVTGAGAIINVNATSNADLFVVLKGGGNNFGVITRYDLKCFNFGTMWGGLKVWPESSSPAQIAAFVNFTNYAHTDPKANLINYWSYNQAANTSTIANVMDYTEPTPNPPIYNQVNAIPGIIADTTRIANLKSYTDELSSAAQRDKQIFLTMTFSNNATMYKASADISNAHLAPLANTPGLIWSLLYQPIPRIVSDNSIANGGNVLGLDRNAGNLILYLLYITWDDPAYDDILTKAAYATVDEIEAKSCELGTDNPYIYLNYAGQYQDVLPGYGTVNINKMKAMSKKYDPTQVFQNLVPGGYKVSDQ